MSRASLADRAEMLARTRAFMADRDILEVDTPSLTPYGSIDAHIDLIEAKVLNRRFYLHSSPEYRMKQLLAEGSCDIYQLSHVFRDGEWGERHQPEFMLLEWYRLGYALQQMIDETCTLVELFIGPQPRRQLTYRQALLDHAGIDYTATIPQLQQALAIEDPPSDREELLHLILALHVEPKLTPKLCILTHFPASQAALAQTDGEAALRFELFFGGYELANGYVELTDPKEHRRRFAAANTPYPLDPHFFAALEHGLPPCCGVAVGFDRLMMLRHQTDRITDICTPVYVETIE